MMLGFIGCGNMAQAIIKGVLKSGLYSKDQIVASDPSEKMRLVVAEECGIKVVKENTLVAEGTATIILAVKPMFISTVIPEIAPYISENKVVISIAAGKTITEMEELFGKAVKIIRTMPNTPALVGEGAAGICCNERVNSNELDRALSIFSSLGIAEVVTENLMNAITGLSGSSPAYAFMFIEAMADAAVADGIPRDMAYRFAAQTVMGSAKMVLETGKHPGELKDMVCSPAGTTIEAVRVLEEKGLRSAVIEAQKACVEKAKSL